MTRPDVALITPFPALGERHGGWTGVAPYSANLAGALTDAGARVTVLAEADGGPAVERDGTTEVRRAWRRGAAALPAAAAAARATGAPAVHLQHELFLYGGAAAVPGIVPALASLRRRRAVVTMHHVVDPAGVDADFMRTHRVSAPAPLVRAGVAGVNGAIRTLADEVVVHEPSFASVVGGARIVPHGIETPERADRSAARAELGVPEDRLCALCFGFLSPYKGLELALAAAGEAGEDVQLVVAGGEHPRERDGYAATLRASAPPNARFTGFVPDGDVGKWFAAADVLLLLYPQPFATSGPLALALAHGTPVLMSPALAATAGAPKGLVTPLEADALAGRLRWLSADAGLHERLRDAAAVLARGRSWPEVARTHLELYGGERVTATTLQPNRRILLAGAFGQANPGDEALLGAFARALPDHVAVVASAAPERTFAEHGLAAVPRDDAAALARTLASSDAVVIAGGTIFKTLHPACGRARHALLARTAALAAAARALRKPLALVGVGAGALEGALARRLARFVVRSADLLVLRDEESAARLAEAGAPTPFRVGADAAWTLVKTPAEAEAAAPTVALRGAGGRLARVELDLAAGDGPVVVALSHLAGGEDLAARLAAGLAPVADARELQLQPWQLDTGHGGDEALAAAVARRLGDRASVIAPPADLDDARERFADAGLVVALRFHAIPAAAAAGTPVLAVSHEPKLEGAARRLGQPTVAAGASPEELTDAVLGALGGDPPPAAAVEAERDRAEEGFRLLRVLLARGRSDEAADVDGLPLRPEEWLG